MLLHGWLVLKVSILKLIFSGWICLMALRTTAALLTSQKRLETEIIYSEFLLVLRLVSIVLHLLWLIALRDDLVLHLSQSCMSITGADSHGPRLILLVLTAVRCDHDLYLWVVSMSFFDYLIDFPATTGVPAWLSGAWCQVHLPMLIRHK